MELVYMADLVIVTVERIVEQVQKSTESAILPAPGATYLVHAPRGAWPTSCYPDYTVAGEEFMRYVDACNAGGFETYLEELLQRRPPQMETGIAH
jgi:hypothetical protein